MITVIPNNEGLIALKHYLDQRPTQDPPTTTLLRLAELVLTLNHFEFNGEHYNQIRGVSMGTRMGPSYACLYMGYVEERFHGQYDGSKPSWYKRYIDDICGATTMPREQLENYIKDIGEFNGAIDFTHEVSEKGLSFLDVDMRIDGDKKRIDTSVHYKPTDSHSYLRYESNHPTKCKESIPYSQFLRLRRICSVESDFNDQVSNMSNFFANRSQF